MVSAPPLCVYLLPTSAPKAAPEHTCPHRQAGAGVSLGMTTGTGTAQGAWWGWHLDRRDLHRWRRLWLEGWVRLLRQAPLLMPAEAGAGAWGRGLQWRPCPLHTTQQWHLASMVSLASSANFPVVELLTPIPSGCLFTANSCPFPGPTLQTPCSSTPHTHQETHNSGWDAQGFGMGHAPRSYSVLPSTDQLLHSPPIS